VSNAGIGLLDLSDAATERRRRQWVQIQHRPDRVGDSDVGQNPCDRNQPVARIDVGNDYDLCRCDSLVEAFVVHEEERPVLPDRTADAAAILVPPERLR
jgi:hypothetical protein